MQFSAGSPPTIPTHEMTFHPHNADPFPPFKVPHDPVDPPPSAPTSALLNEIPEASAEPAVSRSNVVPPDSTQAISDPAVQAAALRQDTLERTSIPLPLTVAVQAPPYTGAAFPSVKSLEAGRQIGAFPGNEVFSEKNAGMMASGLPQPTVLRVGHGREVCSIVGMGRPGTAQTETAGSHFLGAE